MFFKKILRCIVIAKFSASLASLRAVIARPRFFFPFGRPCEVAQRPWQSNPSLRLAEAFGLPRLLRSLARTAEGKEETRPRNDGPQGGRESRKFRGTFCILLITLFLNVLVVAQAQINNSSMISLDLQNVNLPDAIRILANTLKWNFVISPTVHGTTSLHLQHVPAQQALHTLLTSHELIIRQENQVWLILPRAEWLAKQQDQLHFRILEDETAPLTSHFWKIHYAKAHDIAQLLQEPSHSLLSKRGHVSLDDRTNSLYVQDTQKHLTQIQELLHRLDVPVQQVLIQAHLANVDDHFERELGVDFSAHEPVDGKFALAVVHLRHGLHLNMQLIALENAGHAELLSSPSLFTANQQTATIESGEEIPYQEISSSGATGVAFKKAVLSLKVTPQIMPNGEVLLQLQVNQDKPSSRLVLGVPSIDTRQITTNILVKNNQTVVLGGIFESHREQDEQRLPFLGRIPIIGWIFKQQGVADNKRELLIFVTPKIIETS